MNETTDNQLLTLAEAAETVPGGASSHQIWRWARQGLKARSGRIVRLRHSRIGQRIFTTRAHLDAFFAELAEADMEESNASSSSSAA